MTLPPAHPMLLGPALLQHLKRGKPVEKITVLITHETVHHLYTGQGPDADYADVARQLREQCPLEMTLAEGADMEKKIDCRKFERRWRDIDVRPEEAVERLRHYC